MFVDYHVHTTFSFDASSPMEEHILRAIDLGIDELCFTEHVDMDEDPPTYTPMDLSAYLRAIAAMRVKYEGRIRLQCGLEVGLGDTAVQARTLAFLHGYAFDFIIGSTHAVSADRGGDPYHPEYFQGVSKEKAYRRYFEKILENLLASPPLFDVVGHLDYVAKNAPFSDRTVRYAQAPDVFDAIFIWIAKHGLGIEINTSSPRNEPLWGLDLLQRYRALGGEFVTIGSDAHKSDRLGSRFTEALALAKAAGIPYLATFFQHEKTLHKI